MTSTTECLCRVFAGSRIAGSLKLRRVRFRISVSQLRRKPRANKSNLALPWQGKIARRANVYFEKGETRPLSLSLSLDLRLLRGGSRKNVGGHPDRSVIVTSLARSFRLISRGTTRVGQFTVKRGDDGVVRGGEEGKHERVEGICRSPPSGRRLLPTLAPCLSSRPLSPRELSAEQLDPFSPIFPLVECRGGRSNAVPSISAFYSREIPRIA